MNWLIRLLPVSLLAACVAPVTAPVETPTALPPSPAPTRPAPTATPTELPVTRILFTGDINPGRCVAKVMKEKDDFTWPYQALAEELQAADILVGSLDGAITDRADPDKCPETMSLNGPARVVEGLEYAGFDVITVATNHAKNCGIVGCWDKALLDSISHLSEAGIVPVGGGNNLAEARAPVIVERNGVRFAFLAGTTVGGEMWATFDKPGTAPLWFKYTARDIPAALKQADVVIVLAQWGPEYTHVPNWDQFELAGSMMKQGATLVIGNQAHWVQAVEEFPSGVVAYALGNFVFDQPWSKKTQQGVLFEATFRGSALESWRLLPITIDKRTFQPSWAGPEEAEQILANIEAASQQSPLTTRETSEP
jgi:poly-gamma-glutamate capsule biosynthesis protein CapA/YwtB (metallophosphatase superfamily)